mmetsp:Transcript_47305/g.88121  ORF Transcript_47305/g.88121 Transcript_47305/m.88121 type:complete len:80 (-) Transcript_47305:137-376(-)
MSRIQTQSQCPRQVSHHFYLHVLEVFSEESCKGKRLGVVQYSTKQAPHQNLETCAEIQHWRKHVEVKFKLNCRLISWTQ